MCALSVYYDENASEDALSRKSFQDVNTVSTEKKLLLTPYVNSLVRSQSVIMISLTATLLANLIGFAYFTTESNDKQEILSVRGIQIALPNSIFFQRPSVEWVKSNSVNFLVLGGKVGEVGNFIYGEGSSLFFVNCKFTELCLLAVSIIINYAFYISITYHAVYKIGRQMVSLVDLA